VSRLQQACRLLPAHAIRSASAKAHFVLLCAVCDAFFACQSVGRRSLAIKLLEEEPSAAQQVPLLISLAKGGGTTSGQAAGADASPGGGEGAEDTLSRALRKAVDARDPDLVYLVLFAAYRSRPLPEFWKMVGPRPTAHNLFVKYTRIKVRVCNYDCA
jgi:hypothetical protein